MRVSSPSDQTLIQAQWRLDMQGRRMAVTPAAANGDRPDDRAIVPEVRVYEGEYVPGETGRGTVQQGYGPGHRGIFDGAVGYGQTDAGTHRGTPPGVLRYLEHQPPQPDISPPRGGRLGQYLDVYA